MFRPDAFTDTAQVVDIQADRDWAISKFIDEPMCGNLFLAAQAKLAVAATIY